MTSVLSIQSHVAFGHAGNSSAVFALQRKGIDVWPVHTVLFSNHTGYETWAGPVIPASDVEAVVRGMDDNGFLSGVDAVLTGYLGSGEMGQTIIDAAALVKERNPEAIFCADPVMGDVGPGFYALPGVPEFMRDHLARSADIMIPNLFELEYLTGMSTSSASDVLAAAQTLRSMGPEVVVVTSVVGHDLENDVMRMLAVDSHGAWMVETPVLDFHFTGSGDLTAAMFLAEWLKRRDSAQALERTASVVYSILQATVEQGREELFLVGGQQNVVDPTHVFSAQPISADGTH